MSKLERAQQFSLGEDLPNSARGLGFDLDVTLCILENVTPYAKAELIRDEQCLSFFPHSKKNNMDRFEISVG